MRYRGVGAVALATTLLLPGAAWGQMGPGMGRETELRGAPGAIRQLAPPPSRQSEAEQLQVTQAQMSGAMGHHATPFYLESLFLLLVAALATHYGDGLATKARTTLRDRTPALAQAHGLVFAESTGDGSFMTFGSVGSAIRTALALLAELREWPPNLAAAPPLSVRAEIAYGEILSDGRGARHGAVINKAFRLEGLQREAFVHVEEDAMGPEVPKDNRVFLAVDAAQEAGASGFALEAIGFARLKGGHGAPPRGPDPRGGEPAKPGYRGA